MTIPTVDDMVESVPKSWELLNLSRAKISVHYRTWKVSKDALVIVSVDNHGEHGVWLHTSITWGVDRRAAPHAVVAEIKDVIYEDRVCFQIWAPARCKDLNDAIHLFERLDEPMMPAFIWERRPEVAPGKVEEPNDLLGRIRKGEP